MNCGICVITLIPGIKRKRRYVVIRDNISQNNWGVGPSEGWRSPGVGGHCWTRWWQQGQWDGALSRFAGDTEGVVWATLEGRDA